MDSRPRVEDRRSNVGIMDCNIQYSRKKEGYTQTKTGNKPCQKIKLTSRTFVLKMGRVRNLD